jgi:hypothetical protein
MDGSWGLCNILIDIDIAMIMGAARCRRLCRLVILPIWKVTISPFPARDFIRLDKLHRFLNSSEMGPGAAAISSRISSWISAGDVGAKVMDIFPEAR